MPSPKIFLCMPYTGTAHVPAIISAAFKASNKKYEYLFFPQDGPAGSHCENFNNLWCKALNSRERDGWTHFAMIHSDVEPEEFWLDKLYEEQQAVGADVLSVILAIKDNRGVTSTAVQDRSNLYTHRLTLRELQYTPETFNAEMIREPNSDLLISSGLWICDFTKPWVENVWFEMRDRICKLPNGQFFAANFSEDWGFSRQCREQGVKVFSTRKILAKHRGTADYDNRKIRGTWSFDEDASYGEWLLQMKGMSSIEEPVTEPGWAKTKEEHQ